MRSLSIVLAAFALSLVTPPAAAVRIEAMNHIHGIAWVPGEGLRLATHDGLYAAAPDGTVRRLGALGWDLMVLAADPHRPRTLLASGHPAGGGNLGFVVSGDGGRRWKRRGEGASGRADFHVLAVSPRDPGHLVGIDGEALQVSRDGGRTWRHVGKAPAETMSLAISPDGTRLYAAAGDGVLVSRDGGRSWTPLTSGGAPASLVAVRPDGTLYAFVLGRGLVRGRDPGTDWKVLVPDFGAHVPLALVADPESGRLFLLSHLNRVFYSDDGGTSWRVWGRPEARPSAAALRGAAIYRERCARCHGRDGLGEPLSVDKLSMRGYRFAPPLDDSTHAWHHTDRDLVRTILDGIKSLPDSRMPAWRGELDEAGARDVVAYMKTLWGPRARACQGPRHMSCPPDAGEEVGQ